MSPAVSARLIILDKKRSMKKLLIVVFCWGAATCHAQTVDSVSRLAASYFKEAEAACRDQHIWKGKLYGPILFVEPQSRVAYANVPDSAGILKPEETIFKGILPKEVILANTSLYWGGKRWSVMLWPLLTDHDERVNLMVHESFHRIQDAIGFPAHSPTDDHLSSTYGRIYFLMELRALEAALKKPANRRGPDLTNALLFREKRRALFPNTFNNESILEMNEGLAEYTGVILGRPKDSIRKHLYRVIDTASVRKSFIRSAAYMTGPVYGYLLYEKDPEWTLKIDSNADFPALIEKYYQVDTPAPADDATIAALEKQYHAAAMIQSEKAKEGMRLQTVKQYVDLFTHKPVLTIKLVKMGISFNPNTLFDLGEYGTIYPTAYVKDNWGELAVTGGGMLMKDWQVIYVPMGDFSNTNRQVIEGKGWKIDLNGGWRLVKVDDLHYQLAK